MMNFQAYMQTKMVENAQNLAEKGATRGAEEH